MKASISYGLGQESDRASFLLSTIGQTVKISRTGDVDPFIQRQEH